MSKITIALDSQELNTFERCPLRYRLEFLDRLEPKRWQFKKVDTNFWKLEGITGKAKALNKGYVMAQAIENYYGLMIEGKSMGDRILKGVEIISTGEYTEVPDESIPEQKMLLLRSFAQYCEFYAGEKTVPIAVEKGFAFELYNSDDLRIIYEGKPDLIARPQIDEPIYPWDNKTESKRSELHSHSNQFIGYVRALETDKLIVNYIGLQKEKPPKEKFFRTWNTYTKMQLEEWRNNTIHWCYELKRCSEEGKFPQNRSGCDGKYGQCIFTSLCDAPSDWARTQREGSLYKIKEEWKAWR
jgi:hypothetical protein